MTASLLQTHILPPNRFEHVPLAVFANSHAASRAVAAEMAALIRERQREGRRAVLGLATGSTPVGVYAELVRLHREEHLSFANVVTFNLDEYYGLPPEHPHSYHAFMRTHLFDHVDLAPQNAHVPDGVLVKGAIEKHCQEYEAAIEAAGSIDFQVLGIGRTGHIGFNEPGSVRRSRTRFITMDPLTRRDAAGDFGGEEHTPRYAITMGVRTILSARRIVLMAWGQHKADIIRSAVEGEVTSRVTASFLQEHEQAQFVLDQAAADALTRYRTPWQVGALEDQGLEWDDRMTRRAVLWLSQTSRKPILKLTDDDYNEWGLQDLLLAHGSAYDANLAGFYALQHTITGWPGGRDPSRARSGDALVRPLQARSAHVYPKRVLVLSPRPDDAVAAMGGTLCRLVEHGHEVHVAVQASGAFAVSDESLWRALTFVRDSGLAKEADATSTDLCDRYEATGVLPSSPEVTRWKAAIRRTEALAAARVCGVAPTQLHFLDLPFYDGAVQPRRQLTDADIEIMHRLLGGLRPHLIFAAGDMDDPHGTHRLCLRALRHALADSRDETWFGDAELWFYRGASTGWKLDEIDMAVPLSPQELRRRRQAIFRHEAQKDQALFPGNDGDEFWRRSDEGSRRLADAYNAFGLAEYEAIEAFRRQSPAAFVGLASL